jgi:hypothetical protein
MTENHVKTAIVDGPHYRVWTRYHTDAIQAHYRCTNEHGNR